MALSNSERQKRFRQRKREEKFHLPDALTGRLKTPFEEWLTDQDWQDVIHDLDMIGVREIIEFPARHGRDPFFNEDADGVDRGAVGAAERIVTTFLDAAVTMASKINAYKLGQVNARIAEIETADLTDPDIKKQVLAEIAELTNYRDELSKSVRWTLPQWKVKGE
jgi:hypothetical protein